MPTTTLSADALRERLRALEGAIAEAAITVDRRGVIRAVNDYACEMFGRAREDLVGRTAAELMPGEYRAREEIAVAGGSTTLAAMAGRSRILPAVTPEGEEFPIRLGVREVLSGDEAQYICIAQDLRDVTRARERVHELHEELWRANKQLEATVAERTAELKQTVEHLAQANHRLAREVREREEIAQRLQRREVQLERLLSKERELGELRSRFVSMASHEFRTPLTTMLSSVELIEMAVGPDADPMVLKHTGRVREGIGYLRGVLEDFLQLGKLDVQGTDLHLTAFDLCDFFEEQVEQLGYMAKPGQDIELACEGELGQTLHSANALRICITNLVTNAIKYSPEGAAIDVRLRRAGEDCELVVDDEGIGIPENERALLFERFYRASNAETIKGTGLGLHIVARYAQAMGGSVAYEPGAQGGSRFVVRFPYKLELPDE